MDIPPLLDTNVLLRHVLQDHPEHSPRATAYLHRIERGELEVLLTDTVVFETVFTLERLYRQHRSDIRDNLLPLIALPGIALPGKQRLHPIFDLYVTTNLSFADVDHAVLALTRGSGAIVSFDRGFDRVPGIRRTEP